MPVRNTERSVNMRKIITIFTIVVLINTYASAIQCSYNTDTDSVSIKETNGGRKNETITLVIADSDTDIKNLSDTELPNEFIQLRTDRNGKFEYTVNLWDGYESGKYYVYEDNKDNASASFILINSDDLDKMYEKISSSEAVSFLEQKGIAPNNFEEDLNNVEIINELKGADRKNLRKEYEKAMANALIKKGKAETAFKIFEKSLGIDYMNDYDSLSDDVKQMMSKIFAEQWESNGSYDKLSCLSMVITAKNESWNSLKNVISSNAEKCGVNLSGTYSTLRNKENVFAIMACYDIAKYEDINSVFERACMEQKQNETGAGATGGGTSSGGGTGGSGAFNNVSLQPVKKSVYNDIEGHWAESVITAMSKKGCISGYPDGRFRPDGRITRAEFAKILVSAENIEAEYTGKFKDVNESDWFYMPVMKAFGAGIVYGSGDMFNPNDYITREDAACILYRFLILKNISAENTQSFSDDENISAYAKEAVGKMAALNVLKGADGRFMPNSYATRAESAAMIQRVLNLTEGE